MDWMDRKEDEASLNNCPICSQGRQLVAQWDDTKEMVICCEECFSSWRSPEESLEIDKALGLQVLNDLESGRKLTVLTREDLFGHPWENKVLVIELLDYVPQLKDVYVEHMRANGELLPHVFFGDVTRYVVEQVQKGATPAFQPAARILLFLEESWKLGSKNVQELIGVSFLENIAEHKDVIAKVMELLGPNLKRELEKFIS